LFVLIYKSNNPLISYHLFSFFFAVVHFNVASLALSVISNLKQLFSIFPHTTSHLYLSNFRTHSHTHLHLPTHSHNHKHTLRHTNTSNIQISKSLTVKLRHCIQKTILHVIVCVCVCLCVCVCVCV
jgi:hypothetical protein